LDQIGNLADEILWLVVIFLPKWLALGQCRIFIAIMIIFMMIIVNVVNCWAFTSCISTKQKN